MREEGEELETIEIQWEKKITRGEKTGEAINKSCEDERERESQLKTRKKKNE